MVAARYYTGIPCRNGHLSERRLSDRVCVDCEREKERRYLQTEKGKTALWRKNNSDKGRVRRLRWTKTPKGRISGNRNNKTLKGKAARRRFDQTERGKVCAVRSQQAYRARKRDRLSIPYSYQQLVERFASFGNECVYCGFLGKLSEDHFIPLKHNGIHRIQNIVPACLSCNKRKNGSMPEAWYKRQVYFSQERWDWILSHVI